MHLLKGVLERLVTTCAERFREYCNVPSSFFVNQIETGNSWDVLELYEDSIAAIYYSREWDSKIVLGLDRRFVFSAHRRSLRRRRQHASLRSDRPFTSLKAAWRAAYSIS